MPPAPADCLSQLAARLGISAAEAAPFIAQHRGQAIVIKLGGNIFISGDKEKEKTFIDHFAGDIVLLKKMGAHPILIHGGGPAIDDQLRAAAIKVTFVNGLRYTDSATMAIVLAAMAKVNHDLGQAIASAGGRALPCPKGAVLADQLSPDLGWVGRPTALVAAETLTAPDTIAVLAPIGHDQAGNYYNINGDTAAGFIAAQLRAERFLLMTNVAGVLDKEKKLITTMTSQQAQALIADGTIVGGMIPKVQTAIAAAMAGTRAVAIIDGRNPHAVLAELFTASGNGTLIGEL